MVKDGDWWVVCDGSDDVWIYFRASSDSGNEPYNVLIIRDIKDPRCGSILCECMDRKCRHKEGHILHRNRATCKHIARVWELIDLNKLTGIIQDNKEKKRKCQRHKQQ